MSTTEPEPERRARTRAFWDDYALRDPLIAIYDSADVRDRGEDAFWRAGEEDARRLAWFFRPGARVLEIGCGIGRMLRFLAPRCSEIVGVDISAEMIAQGRAALGGVPNVRWMQTSGASLAGVAGGSIDFVYALLVLIHVDRRSAFRYLEEIRRVLAPGGLAFLQFQNLETPEGIAGLRGVLDSDYPLEFYTDAELRYLFGEIGLDVVACFAGRQFLFYTLLAGDAAAWRGRIARGVSAIDARPRPNGDLDVELCSTLAHPQPLRLELSVTRAGRQVRCDDAYLDLPPGRARLAVRRGDGRWDEGRTPAVTLDGAALDVRRVEASAQPVAQAEAGAVTVHVALQPPGFLASAAHAAAFPGLVHAWDAAGA